MQAILKYYLFSFLILFTVINLATAEPRIAPATNAVTKFDVPGQKKLQAIETVEAPPTSGDIISHSPGQTDFSLCNTKVVQTAGSFIVKRTHGDKDLLLLHAARYSKAVKVSAVGQVKFTDSLTHISLFLFPYHFYW